MQFLSFVLVIMCVLKPLNPQPDSAKYINFLDVLEKTGLDCIPEVGSMEAFGGLNYLFR